MTSGATDPPPPADAPPWRPATFRALRHRDYRLYFFGQMVSLTGSWVQTTAIMWLVFELTGKSAWPSLIATAQILPLFLLGTWGGSLADRVPRRALIMTTQAALLALALVVATLVHTGLVNAYALLALALVSGTINAIDLPTRLAFVNDMVGRDDLVNAVALNSVLFNAARLIGPWVGGEMLARLGPAACFLLNGLSYLAVLAALGAMTTRGAVRRAPAGSRPGLRGLRPVLAAHPIVLLVIALTGCLSLFGWPFLVLLPSLAARHLGLAAGAYSRLLAGTGAGALLAAFTLASVASLRWRRPFLAAAILATAAGLLGLSLTGTLLPAVACCALTGFGLVLFNATAQSVVQLSADDYNRGLVMGLWSTVIGGALPLGNLVVGTAADRWGEPAVLRAQGVACLAASVALFALHATRTARAARKEPAR